MNNIAAIHQTIKRRILGYLMLCGLLSLPSTIQAAKPAQQLMQGQAPVLSPSTAANKAAEKYRLPPDQLLIPANGHCLYTTVIMGYLLPVRQEPHEVTARIDQLFGMQPAYYLNELHQTLQNPTHYLTYLHSDAFSTLVTTFMARMQIKKGTWGGPAEIQTIATKLKVNIQAYYPDPSNPTNLVQSDLIKPAQANADITIHIVLDKVHPAEVLTQAEKASAADNPHYQHYRLKYTLLPSISVPVLSNRHSSIPPVQMLELTEEEVAYNLNPNIAHSSTLASYTDNAHNGTTQIYDYSQEKGILFDLIDDENQLDKEDAASDLKKILQLLPKTQTPPQLLQAILFSHKNNRYTKYLFESTGLLIGDKAQKFAHNKLSLHLIKSAPMHVGLQLLSFLAKRGNEELHHLAIPKDDPLCPTCATCCSVLFDQKIEMHQYGCQSKIFPNKACHAAIDCFYSSRFNDRQRRKVFHNIDAHIFPEPSNPKKTPSNTFQKQTNNPSPIHGKTLILHQIAQIPGIKVSTFQDVLSNLDMDINTLDKYGKTALDYINPHTNSTVYQFLKRKGAASTQKSNKQKKHDHIHIVQSALSVASIKEAYKPAQPAHHHPESPSKDDNYLIPIQKYFRVAEKGDRKFLKGHLDCAKFAKSVDLRNLNLQGINFSQATLPKHLSGTNLTKAKLPQDLSKHNLTHTNLSKTDLTNVKLPQDLSGVNFTDAKLPKDLSNHNLTHANLTGQCLTATNFEGTILTNTLCDYQQCFQDHIKANKLSGGRWYRDNFPKDLKSIAQVYPQLSQNTHKAELLQIASGLAYLPYWEDREFYIKVYYWSCKLLLLKKQLSSELGAQIVCSLENYSYGLNYEANNYCWQTDYSQKQVDQPREAPHDDFDQYLKTFQAGLQKYNCESEYNWGYDWYKDNIEKNIQGLQTNYPQLIALELQKEAVDIAFQLSKSYQNQHWGLLFRYLFLQNRLIQLKVSAGVEFHYNCIVHRIHAPKSWSRS